MTQWRCATFIDPGKVQAEKLKDEAFWQLLSSKLLPAAAQYILSAIEPAPHLKVNLNLNSIKII